MNAASLRKALFSARIRRALTSVISALRWAWGIPFIRSAIITRLTQAGIIGAILLALADKTLA